MRPFLIFSTERWFGDIHLGVGGFADRLKGAAVLCAVAEALGAEFYIEWNHPFQIERNFPSVRSRRIPEQVDIKSLPTLNWLDCDIDNFRDGLIAVKDMIGRGEGVRIHANIFYQKHWDLVRELFGGNLEPDVAIVLGRQLRKLFIYSPPAELATVFDSFKSSLDTNGETIAFQVRIGGERAWSDPALTDASEIPKIIEKVLTIHGQIPTSIFITADSLEVKRLASDHFRAHGVKYIQIAEFDEVHLDRSKNPDEFGVDMTIMDFILMSQCRKVYYGRGEFAKTAAIYGGVPYVSYL